MHSHASLVAYANPTDGDCVSEDISNLGAGGRENRMLRQNRTVSMLDNNRDLYAQEQMIVVEDSTHRETLKRELQENRRQTEKQSLVLDMRTQQLLNYTHEHVQRIRDESENRISVQIQEGIQASHEYTQAALQAHCTSIGQLVQSNLREESAKFNAEVQVSGSKLRSPLEGYVDQIQAHQDTRMAALISAQLRAERNSIEDAWRAFTIDETDALERRIEERLRESRQQQEGHLAQMQESFQNHLPEEKARAESDGRTRTSINADTMMTHINERVKSEVRVEVESMTGRVEETIQNNLKAERERQNAQHAQEHDKRLKVAIERSIPLITIAANETVAKTVDERQSRFEKHIQQQIDAIRITLSPTQTLNTPCVHDLRMAPLAWTEPSISMKDGAAAANPSAVIAFRQDAARRATYTAVFEVSPQTPFANVPCAERAALGARNLREAAVKAQLRGGRAGQRRSTPAETTTYVRRAAKAGMTLRAAAAAKSYTIAATTAGKRPPSLPIWSGLELERYETRSCAQRDE